MTMERIVPPYADKRNDGRHIGPAIRMVRLMLEEGYSRDRAADQVKFSRTRARRALERPHVVAFRRREKMKLLDELSARVPLKLSELMDSENANAAVRACVALHGMAAGDELVARRGALVNATPGLTIQIVTDHPALPLSAPPVTIEHAKPQLIERGGEDE